MPQRAGKAYAIFEKAVASSPSPVEPKPAQPVQGKKRKRDIKYKVSAIVQPEPDMRKLAKALLSIAREGRSGS